jgi:Calcium-binding EGF domain
MQSLTKCADTDKFRIPDTVRLACCDTFVTFDAAPTELTNFDSKSLDSDEEFEEDCDSGFMKESPEEPCEDMDECQRGEHNCGHSKLCVNTLGSFYCKKLTCSTGYKWNFDNKKCEGELIFRPHVDYVSVTFFSILLLNRYQRVPRRQCL